MQRYEEVGALQRRARARDQGVEDAGRVAVHADEGADVLRECGAQRTGSLGEQRREEDQRGVDLLLGCVTEPVGEPLPGSEKGFVLARTGRRG